MCSITVVCIYPPPDPPKPNPPPSLASTLLLGFVHVFFIVVPENPCPHYPLPPSLWLLGDIEIILFFKCFFNGKFFFLKKKILWSISVLLYLTSLLKCFLIFYSNALLNFTRTCSTLEIATHLL